MGLLYITRRCTSRGSICQTDAEKNGRRIDGCIVCALGVVHQTAGRQELNRGGRSGEGAAVRDRQFGSCVSSDLLDREGSSETLVIEMSILGL